MNYTTAYLTKALNITWDRIDRWIQRNKLPFHKINRIRYISKDDFINWAVQNKSLISNIERDRLLEVIGDSAIVDAIKATPYGRSQDWKPHENEWLEEASGSMPPELITKHLNKLNKANGYMLRTESAVRAQMSKRGLSVRCTLDHFTAFGLANALEVDKETVCRWIKRHGLQAKILKRRKQKTYAITRDEFKRWAKQNPDFLHRIDRENLLFLLDCPKLVDRILSSPRRPHFNSKFVQNIDTGEVYTSVREAAESIGCNRRRISEAASNGHRCKGFYWQYVEKMELTA